MLNSTTWPRNLSFFTLLVSCLLVSTAAARPNFVIIMADDLGYGDISCFEGWVDTPRLDQLAGEGLRLTDYHSNGAVCSPTRAALMTGRYQQRVGVPGVIVARRDAAVHRTGIGDSEVTFAEALRQQGYATAIYGKWHLGYLPQFNPVRHGFDEFRGYISGNVDFFSHIDQAGHLDWWQNDKLRDEAGYVTHLITKHAVRFIQQNQKRPFCLYLAHEAPHYPYQGPSDSPERTVGGSFVNHGSRKDKKDAYREMVEELDSSIGAVIDKLKELELEQNTFVFFCSDNGATRLGSNGRLRGHKGSVWEGGHRVPAIAWWPGKIAPSSSDATAISMDLLPTLLATANVPLPNEIKIDGTDLSPVLFGTGRLPRRTLCWSTGRGLALRRDNWKLVKSGEKAQLFNLADDLSEATDLSQEHPDKLSDLMTRARTWQIDVEKVSGESPPEATQHFDTVVAPALATNCLGCHNSTERKGGLDLSSRQSMARGGESGRVVTPGNLSDSLLWQRIADAEMPPDEPLSQNDKNIIRKWIEAGASWGTDPIDAFRFTTKHRAGRDWWSFQPLLRPTIPAGSTGKNPIDAFVRDRLRQAELSPSGPADARGMVRRLSFNLRGLPPTLRDIEVVEKESTPAAYARLARQYLASRHYGEHWARHWLDVARYGESDGFEYDRIRPNAWPYRDWVIEALNDDMPFDQFAQQQIAGDILQPDDGQAITATGFLVCGAHDSLIPQGDVMRQIMRQDTLEDFVGTVSQTFLGLTVNCARCHDHKFDPITQREYYQMTAALAGVTHGERSFQPNQETVDHIDEQLQRIRANIESIDAPVRSAILATRQQGEQNRQNESNTEQTTPIAEWDFTSSFEDQLGSLHAKPLGGARRDSNGAALDGRNAYLATPPIQSDLRAKTLEVWVRLGDLDQRGGGAMSLQTIDGGQFDAIVFGEREPKKWMAGSDGFSRTSSFHGTDEAEADKQVVHFAITYTEDGAIAGYRNGRPYGAPYASNGPLRFKSGEAQVMFGLRHGQPGDNRMLRGVVLRARLYDKALTAEQVAASADSNGQFVSTKQIIQRLDQRQRHERATLVQRREQLQRRRATLTTAKVFAAVAKSPGKIHFLNRGNPLEKGDTVTPGGINAIQNTRADFQLAVDAPDADRRRRLAEWIASPNNPLFARVIVNRLWHYHFGHGLVMTPNDFGFNGGQPSHPRLLEWLACELIERDWSLKEIHYLIVTSETFRQSSLNRPDAMAKDADNRLLWRFSPRRLSAEELRDTILSVTGQLNPSMGGPPFKDVRPYFHRGAQFYEPIDPEGKDFNRRSIYRMWARGGRNPLLDAFDCPDPSATAPKRAVTTTPIQALTMMNSSFVMRMSELFAMDLQTNTATTSEQVRRAYERALARPPDALELESARAFVERHNLAAFCRVLLNSNEFLYVE